MPRKTGTALLSLAVSIALLLVSLAWFLGSTIAPENDEEWRWTQPFVGSPLPSSPTPKDLYKAVHFGPSPSRFIVNLTPRTYGYAIAEEAPIEGGHFVVRDSNNTTAGEVEWGASSGLGYSAYGPFERLDGGLTEFNLSGEGRLLLLALDITLDMQDGSATVSINGQVASSLPLGITGEGRPPSSRVHLAWSADGPLRVTVLDQNFHLLAQDMSPSGDMEIRAGGSHGIYYLLEGASASVTLRAFVAGRLLVSPIIPDLAVIASMILFAFSARSLLRLRRVKLPAKPE